MEQRCWELQLGRVALKSTGERRNIARLAAASLVVWAEAK
jgi:hypothetical protein